MWVELVESRKRRIESGSESDNNFGLFFASLCQITRDQLAEWDNSARAWLRRADNVKQVQQTQLMLVCNNIDLPVNLKLDVYDNVIAGWTDSLRGMESLLSGLPQRVQDGSLLLSLSSWHIYPNMTVSKHCPVCPHKSQSRVLIYSLQILGKASVKQNDCLVPDVADIILNMESSPAHVSRGVYWCLSLSKLR